MTAFEEALAAKRARQRALEAEAGAALVSKEAQAEAQEGRDLGPEWMAQHEQHCGEAPAGPPAGVFEGYESIDKADLMLTD